MSRFFLSSILFLLMNIALSAQSVSDSTIQAILQARIDVHHKSTGIVVGYIEKGKQHIVGYGTMNGAGTQPVDSNTIFEIGSITKVFTSLLLADMVEHGEVKLDDSVAAFLPKSVHLPTRNGKQITLLDLATHTSGLPRMPDNFAPKDPTNPYVDYTVEQMYDFLSHYSLTRDIGAQYEYSNLGAGLLGHVLALKAGMGYEELIKRRILKPLGMHSTAMTLLPGLHAHLATGHDENGQAVHNWDFSTLAGAGALRSTVHDMMVFLRAEMGSVSSSLSAAMDRSQIMQRKTGQPGLDIGLGWHIFKRKDTEIIWHNGGTGGYHSFIGFDEKNGRGIVVLSNSANDIDDIGLHLIDNTVPLADFSPPKEHKAITLDPHLYDGYVGKYQLAPNFILTITKENDHLFLQATGQGKLELFPESETDFFLKEVDAQISFVKDHTGQAQQAVLHQNKVNQTAERVK